MLLRLMHELAGLREMLSEQAACVAGRDFTQESRSHSRGHVADADLLGRTGERILQGADRPQ